MTTSGTDATAATSGTDATEIMRLRYIADQVTTASPAQRLLMLFDYLHRHLAAAERGFEEADLKLVSDSLVQAQEIIVALRDPLDPATDLGRSLSSVYAFCLGRLVEANVRKDPSLVVTCREMLDQIAEANRQAAAAVAAGEVRSGAA